MGINKQFDAMIDILKNMPVKQKEELIATHKEFGRLREYCVAKKYVEVLGTMNGIKVLKKNSDVLALKKILIKLNPGGFQWIERGKDLFDKSKKKV